MKYTKEELINNIMTSIENKSFVKGTISQLLGNYSFDKIILKPVLIKENYLIQMEKFQNKKAFHENISMENISSILEEILDNFKQFLIITTTEELHIIKSKNSFNCKSKTLVKKEVTLTHNREKNYILNPQTPIPFLIELGVMTKEGHITKEKSNKFRQINRYLEFIEDTLKELQRKKLIKDHITVVDFGCGKSYLTFALYHYLKNIKNMKLNVIGLDLKKDVIDHCNAIAKKLNFENLEFLEGNIKDFNKLQNVDLIFSLHACNNATDYSILKGLEMNAKAILAVPCCQSEFNQKINKTSETGLKTYLSPLTKHGILQERFSSLATDALRSLSLELCGYKTQVMEFIDMEHTPKNILIKSIREDFKKEFYIERKNEYDRYINFLGIEPLLNSLIKTYYKI
ncbi:MAG: class I SAM-dependent methyltransferase [Cetobacterium sp.]|uniref:class I SAM-dependent methyltransferase n=1 Tax=Cetobacterium sp. TaxID=2071632 RepID=UPI003F3DFAF1